MKKMLLILLSCWLTPLLGQSVEEDLQEKLGSIHTMSALFSQTVTAGKKEISRSKGSMALERPGKFRWQTKSPTEQLIVADGQRLWIYEPDLEQVTVKKQSKKQRGTAALFLSEYNNTLVRDFTVKASNLQSSKVTYFLRAKSPKEAYQHLTLTFEQNKLVQIGFDDQLGQLTSISLQEVKCNLALSPDLFAFIPPKGVDVIQQ